MSIITVLDSTLVVDKVLLVSKLKETGWIKEAMGNRRNKVYFEVIMEGAVSPVTIGTKVALGGPEFIQEKESKRTGKFTLTEKGTEALDGTKAKVEGQRQYLLEALEICHKRI